MSKQQSKEYHYFDTPDGEDIDKKLTYVLKRSGLASMALATCDVMLNSHPKGYLATFGRYVYICLPLMGVSAAFVVTTNLATNFRKKDDVINWALGAVAAGGCFGAWRKSTGLGVVSATLFTVLAVLKKHASQNGWPVIPDKYHRVAGGVLSVRHDYSLLPDKPGNWTTGKSE